MKIRHYSNGPSRYFLPALWIGLLLALSSCSSLPFFKPTPTPTGTATPTAVPSDSPAPPTQTLTPAPTATATVTLTPTPTVTASITLTPTETQAPDRPARLFPFRDAVGRSIDWSYTQLTSYSVNSSGKATGLTGFMAFQLTDRGIHRFTIHYIDQDLTVYYLNVQHTFNKSHQPLKLVIGGTFGADIPVRRIPAGGNAYLQVRFLTPKDTFNPFGFHKDANLPFESRPSQFQDLLLQDLEPTLADLPDTLILLAEAPILFDSDFYPEMRTSIDTVPYLAARYMPYVTVDEIGKVVDASPQAKALANLFLNARPPAVEIPFFSCQTLVVISQP